MIKMFKNIFVFFVSFIVYWVSAFLRGGYITLCGLTGFPLSMIVGSLLYSFSTYVLLYKLEVHIPKIYILFSILAGCSFLEIPLRVFDFKSTLVSFPDYLSKIMAILLSYWIYVTPKRILKLIILWGEALVIIIFAYVGYDMWLDKLNFGTITGRVEQTEAQTFQLLTEQGDTISNKDLKGQYVVLDFWHRYCGICFESFPNIEQLYMECKKQPETIALYSVNLKMEYKEEVGEFDLIRNKGYSFPVLQTSDEGMLQRVFGVKGFPTTIILNPKGDIIFRGNIKNASKYIKKQLELED